MKTKIVSVIVGMTMMGVVWGAVEIVKHEKHQTQIAETANKKIDLLAKLLGMRGK